MRASVLPKLIPVAGVVLACLAAAACNKQGEHLTATGTEFSSEFASQAVSVDLNADEQNLPPINKGASDSASN